MKLSRILFVVFLGMAVQPANAAKFAMELGLHGGGDELVRVIYSSGSTSSVRAGQLISLSIGAGFDLTQNLTSRLTFGYKGDGVTASNGDVTFSRYPINWLLLYRTGYYQIGGGLTYHMSPKLKGTGAASFVNAEFDDATGALLEADYFFSPRSYFGFRFTSIDYKLKSSSTSVNGNSVGIVLGALL